MWALAIGFCLGGSCLTSCTDDDGNGNGGGNEPPVPADTDEAYVIAATVDDASYLVVAPSLDEGSVSTVGQGTEVIEGTYWVFKDDKYVFALVYNKGGAGTGASYYLNEAGQPTKKYTYEYNRITTYGTWGDYVITASTGDSTEKDGDDVAQALLFNYLDATTGSQSESAVLAENFSATARR